MSAGGAMAGALAAGGVPRALTRFIGREQELARLVALLADHRLVTLVGMGGVGKTRLAAEVAARMPELPVDEVRWVDLTAVREPGWAAGAVATALGAHQRTDRAALAAVVEMMSSGRTLLVLDNCEHVIAGVAELCAGLLSRNDEVRILATSREPLGVPGEVRLRVRPLAVPDLTSGGSADSEGVTLFLDRVRLVDSQFELTGESAALVRQIVGRVDGLPLAIELAAARYESLGLNQLLQRLAEPLLVLADGPRTTPPRHRSLRQTVDWSYRLLTERQQRVFRRVAVFSAPFTLAAADAVCGEPVAAEVLHLVDSSMLAPPTQTGDGDARYLMLEGLRAFALERLVDADEQDTTDAVMRDYYTAAAIRAAVGIETPGGELAAARWFDAEDALVHQAFSWALERGQVHAVRLAIALAGWWRLRGRAVVGYRLLHEALKPHCRHDDDWLLAQLWLGRLAQSTAQRQSALDHFTTVCDEFPSAAPTPTLVEGLAGRSGTLRNLLRLAEATDTAHQALDLAQRLRYAEGEVFALTQLSLVAAYGADAATALEWAARAAEVATKGVPDRLARRVALVLSIAQLDLDQLGDAAHTCAEGLRQSRVAGDVPGQADFLDLTTKIALRTGSIDAAGSHIRESLRLTAVSGDRLRVLDCLDDCAHLCAVTDRPVEAMTLWAAHASLAAMYGPELQGDMQRRRGPLRTTTSRLAAGQVRDAQDRGRAMTLDAAAAFATLLVDDSVSALPGEVVRTELTPRERELITLLARGRTDAEIAQELFISIRTVRSHLDRIRDKTGSRRRAELTRLALHAGLV